MQDTWLLARSGHCSLIVFGNTRAEAHEKNKILSHYYVEAAKRHISRVLYFHGVATVVIYLGAVALYVQKDHYMFVTSIRLPNE